MNAKILLLIALLSASLYGSKLGDYFLEQLNSGTPVKLSMVKKIYNQEHKIKDKKDMFGSPLHQAVKFSNLEVVKFLISKGARVNEHAFFIGTPLHVAVAYGRDKVSKFLIQKGAKISSRNGMGLTPLKLAKLYKYKRISHYLEKLILSSRKKKREEKGTKKYLTYYSRKKINNETVSNLSSSQSYSIRRKKGLSYRDALMDLRIDNNI